MSVRYLVLVLVVCCTGMLFSNMAYAQEPPNVADTIAVITSPVTGGVISGQVIIRGSAAHPTAFAYYELEYANLASPSPIWLPITGQIRQQAPTDEILGVWDTVGDGVSDGLYQIRLRVFLTDPNIEPVEVIVTNLQLINSAPTPLPTIDESLNPPAPTPGPSPTSPIELPPTNTPRPTIAVIANEPAQPSVSSTDTSSSIDFGRLQSAFCTGSILALFFFGILFAYLSIRSRLRPITRQLMWQMRDFDDER
ncbi:MAG: hypothetical protein CUN55_01020 [Phototrophicales bacterium]|nr:MAG: hypothetical protein CUN55_01020 [Phototrophicales bacterium]